MPKLSDPIKIGKKEVKNRIWAAPMVLNYGDYFGNPTAQSIESYEERAKGGYGLVCIEATTMDTRTSNFAQMLSLTRDKNTAAWNKLAEVIHRWGAVAVVQLQHGGRCSAPWLCDEWAWGDCAPRAPSAEAPPYLFRPPPKEMSEAEIEEVIGKYVKSITLAKLSGLDGVLLHGTHGFLLHQFLSPWTNRRIDKWGIREGKYLFWTEVIRRAREAVGTNFIIGARIPGEDNLDAIVQMLQPGAKSGSECLTLDVMAKQVAPQLVEAGLDYLDVTTGVLEAIHHLIPILYQPRGSMVHYAEEIRKCVKVPVVGGGKVCDPLLAERLVEENRLDAVFVGRQLFADPDFPKKYFEGRRDDIRKCLSCDVCTLRLFNQWEVKCASNPDFGPIKYKPIERVKKPKKVLVVGGGVAGMEAARVASQMGHEVVLCEKDEELGGIVKGVAELPRLYTADLGNIVEWQKHQIAKSAIDVRLNTEVTAETVAEIKPDAVILATGARFDGTRIKGHNKPIVTDLNAYLKGETKVGKRVVVIGGAVGAEPAVSLAREGKEVTLLEEGPQLGPVDFVQFQSGIGSAPWMYLYRTLPILTYLGEAGAKIFAEVKNIEITDTGVTFLDKDGKAQTVGADTVIIAVGHSPNKTLARALKGKVHELYEVGDCITPARIYEATHSAHHIVRDVLSQG